MKIPFWFHKKILETFHAQLIVSMKTDILFDNKIVKSTNQIARSLTGTFNAILYIIWSGNDNPNWIINTWNGGTSNNQIKNTAGALTSMSSSLVPSTSNGFAISAAAGSLLTGIIFGQGNIPPNPLDYNIPNEILSGSGANQLNYAAQTSIQNPTVAGQTTSFIINRVATNNSGADITVTDIFIQENIGGGASAIIFHEIGSWTLHNGQSINPQITFAVTT